VESLNYGAAGALAFKPPAWPDLPAAEREKVEMGVLLKMLGVVANLFAGDSWTGGVGGAGG
jgi:hypothetical protein